ncbi:hydroxymethylglutaryl-CoA lyase [Fretibacter rubidus]|uniref:hydroxymethylglutaryl-CoA lyase n=1 Tax=Fretibacter rubidus TaxID=570162 RepID=UPI00352B3CD4
MTANKPTHPSFIEIVDVSARDGLQNEDRLFSTDEKLALINRAVDSGLRRIEVSSFVHPKRVPQMADAEAVIAGLPDRKDVTFIGLTLNERGLDRALETKIDEVGCVVVASDGFAMANQGQTSAESVSVAKAIIKRARAEKLPANVTISTAFGCPFDGEVPLSRVVDICKALADSGTREIAIADTIGVGNPWHVTDMVAAIKDAVPDMPLRAHFHNTRNMAVANVYAAVTAGVVTLDGTIGGIGGCPFAPNATGNVALEDVIYMLHRAGVGTGVSLDQIIETAQWLSGLMARDLPGMVSKAGSFPKQDQAS